MKAKLKKGTKPLSRAKTCRTGDMMMTFMTLFTSGIVELTETQAKNLVTGKQVKVMKDGKMMILTKADS